MLQIAVTGKPNVGKSSFFNAATLSEAEVASYPFTTIDVNKAVTHVVKPCPCQELEVECNPRNSQCLEGQRLIPVELLDVAGLVPGAHEGRGLGNKFLDDLRQARVFIHVIDASGSTDEEGRPCEAGSHDPMEDVDFLQHEITMWLFGILHKNWNRLVRKALSEKLDIAKVIAEQLSGAGIMAEDVLEAKRAITKEYKDWEDEDMILLLDNLLKIAKPMMIVANKADLPHAEENIQRLKEKYDNVVPASAEAELALSRAAEAGLIKYTSGEDDFEILQADKLSPQQLKALEYIRENVLQKYGGTGVQEALNQAIFNLLDMIVVYPVEDEHKLSDQKGNVLPDALLIPRGSKPRDMAFLIHTDIGEGFMHAIDARSCRRVSSDHELQDGDIISIITR
ncbi:MULTISPECIES: redox-regulated ATPase YchF [Methanobacterium]|jgi:ribosome-binding ATPase YchF (GTP1/OBG family)|uniref:Putative GTP-binding protein MJ1332 n=1 Tax=Methanobacterium formicicum TaxID=2162 RepID=A0A089ZUM4_METFO|nr:MULTISPECIES: redox-regulated ATPase YchF [Methanobacterium]AIS30939.1 translation-associated GTPase [Methanobacterium formicicum]MBF4474887.1 redox-regulated ATPase YchF [Methanobacterium formicicum]CEL23728.1 putative GTP-binding protein MJ1332 [Methanobacterium formicicum]